MRLSKKGLLLAVATSSLALGANGIASAKSYTAKANLQGGNGYCGANLVELPVIGTANFKRLGNRLNVQIVMTHGAPNTTYYDYVYGNGCELLGVVGQFTTNKKGEGQRLSLIHI